MDVKTAEGKLLKHLNEDMSRSNKYGTYKLANSLVGVKEAFSRTVLYASFQKMEDNYLSPKAFSSLITSDDDTYNEFRKGFDMCIIVLNKNNDLVRELTCAESNDVFLVDTNIDNGIFHCPSSIAKLINLIKKRLG